MGSSSPRTDGAAEHRSEAASRSRPASAPARRAAGAPSRRWHRRRQVGAARVKAPCWEPRARRVGRRRIGGDRAAARCGAAPRHGRAGWWTSRTRWLHVASRAGRGNGGHPRKVQETDGSARRNPGSLECTGGAPRLGRAESPAFPELRVREAAPGAHRSWDPPDRAGLDLRAASPPDDLGNTASGVDQAQRAGGGAAGAGKACARIGSRDGRKRRLAAANFAWRRGR